MPRPSMGPKSYWASLNVFCQTKKWFTYYDRTKAFALHQKMVSIYALSEFYRSQNILGWSKFFVSELKLIDILLTVPIFSGSTKCNSIFGQDRQIIWDKALANLMIITNVSVCGYKKIIYSVDWLYILFIHKLKWYLNLNWILTINS